MTIFAVRGVVGGGRGRRGTDSRRERDGRAGDEIREREREREKRKREDSVHIETIALNSICKTDPHFAIRQMCATNYVKNDCTADRQLEWLH